jgi:hypothetical protein
MGRGAVEKNIAIVGINFKTGTWTPASVLFSGNGITVNSVTRVNTLLLVVNLSVNPTAELTARSITVINPDGGRGTVTNAFTITPAPTISSLSPSSRGRGAANESVVVNGAGFVAGSWPSSSVAFSGTGITVNSVTRNSATKLTVSISIASDAQTGARAVTVENADGGLATKPNAFTVLDGPSITSVNPGSRPQGASSQNIVIGGSNFASGVAVTFSGSGITVNSVTRNSAGQLTVKISIASNAAVGGRIITVRNPDGGTATSAFTVNAKPTITSLSPNSSPRNQTNKTILINGSGFAAGATVAFSGSGITVVAVTVTNGNQLSVKINVAGSAPTGFRNVTVTNTDGGTITLSGGFRIT